MKNLFLILLALITMTLGAQHARAAESVVINNSSFELGTYNGANPWYGSTLDGWTINAPLANWVGKDDGTGPADNGLRPDRGHVVFMQAGWGANSRIRQAITLDPSKTYCLQFWHNAAGASSQIPTNIFDVSIQWNGGVNVQWLGKGQSGYTNTPVGGANPYYFEQIIFTAGAANVELRFRNLPMFSDYGNSILLLDGITLFALSHPNEVIIKNPSFEASSSYTGFIGGYAPALNDRIAGWNCAAFGFGVRNDLTFSPYIDGSNAYRIYVQNWPPYPASSEIKQTVNGLTSGQGYYLRYTYGASYLAPSNFTVSVGGTPIYTVEVTPLGVNQRTDTFTANASSMELKFTTSPTEGADLFLDNIMIWPVPEPAGLLVAGLCALALRLRRS